MNKKNENNYIYLFILDNKKEVYYILNKINVK